MLRMLVDDESVRQLGWMSDMAQQFGNYRLGPATFGDTLTIITYDTAISPSPHFVYEDAAFFDRSGEHLQLPGVVSARMEPAVLGAPCPRALVRFLGVSLGGKWTDWVEDEGKDDDDASAEGAAEVVQPALGIEGYENLKSGMVQSLVSVLGISYVRRVIADSSKVNDLCTYDRNAMKTGITLSVHHTDRSSAVSVESTRAISLEFKSLYLDALRAIQKRSDYLPQYAPLPVLTINVTGHRRVGTTTIFRYDAAQNGIELRW